MKTVGLERAAQQALRRALSEVPFLTLGPTNPDRRVPGARSDFTISVKTDEGRFRLICQVKSSGQPRIAREACLLLRRYTEPSPRDYPVFIAPYISQQAAEICTREGVGYLDLAGNCRLAFGRVYIQKDRYPNPFIQRRDLRSLYSSKAERVLRVLLADPKRAWKTQALADEAQVSLGQVANVKKLLSDKEWVRADQNGLSLSNPASLLSEWSANYRFSRNVTKEFYSLNEMAQTEAEITEACRKLGLVFGFTGFSGAARLAPAVRYQRVTVYVSEEFDLLAREARLKPVPSGANVTLLTPYDEGVFYGSRQMDGATILSPVQIYLDLLGMKGRGEEAANAILEEVITPSWR